MLPVINLLALAGVGAGAGWGIMRKRVIHVDIGEKSSIKYGPWRGIALHYTAGKSLDGMIQTFSDPERKASAHYGVGKNGLIVQMVPLNRLSWHAGVTLTPDIGNDDLVGIEVVNYGLREKPYPGAEPCSMRFVNGQVIKGYQEPFTGPQVAALVWLLADLRLRGIPLNLYGHNDIAAPMGRKIDPGPLFPWDMMPGRRIAPKTERVV